MEGWQAVADDHGIFSAQDALRAGVTARDLAGLVQNGHAIRVARGWYSLPLPRLPVEIDTTWERRRRLHAVQTRAAVIAYAGRAVASHHSALVLHGLPAFAADLRQVHLTRTADRWSRRRRGLTLHEMVKGAMATDGVIDAAVAIAQTGCSNGAMSALIAADAGLRRGLVTGVALAEAADLMTDSRMPGVRAMLRHAEPTAASPGETRLRHALRLMGFAVVAQVPIVDGPFSAIVDFLVEGCVVIEFDGFVKYGRQRAYATDAAPADLVFAEKVREDHVRELGHEMVRVIWSDLDALPQLRRRVGAAVVRAGVRRDG